MFTLPKWHAALAVLLAMAAIGNAAAQTRMRLWVIHPDDYPVTIAARSFASEVGKKSGGRIQIDVIGTDVIRDQAEAQKMLKDGKLEMGEFNLAMLSEAVPSMKALNLPFLFSDSKHMFSLLDGEMGRTFEKRLGEVGFVNLGWYDGGSRSFYCAGVKLASPRDFKGLRIRVIGSEVFKEMASHLGATPVSIPYKDVAAAFERKEIDCAENNLPSFVSSGHYKYAKHMLLTDHMVLPEALIIGAANWKKLAKEDQTLIADEGRKSALLMRELWNKRVEESRAIAVKAGVTFDRPLDFGSYLSRMKPLHQKYWKDPEMRTELVAILSIR
ncbi:MAG: TRAP transporter substrate-binding protein DctP [Burkholderiales bacterium]